MTAVVSVILVQRLHVGGKVDACFLSQVIDVSDLTVNSEVVPPDVGKHHDVRKVAAGQRRVELLRSFLVVLASINEFDLDVWVFLLEAGDDFGFYVLGGTRVVGPPGQLRDFAITGRILSCLWVCAGSTSASREGDGRGSKSQRREE